MIRRCLAFLLLAPCVSVLAILSSMDMARAQDGDGALIEVKFTPTARTQLAIWMEDDRGRLLRTFALTESVAYRGIGNRPGASQMNSGYRWPYGRREGALPIWATRRASSPNAKQFKRVIFQDRDEGRASQTAADNSVDDYFCLSFTTENSGRDALDAVSCATVFNSDKGRFITEADVAAQYAEPYEATPGVGEMAPLSQYSLYPPRMDVDDGCGESPRGCYDHPDVLTFADHAREVMPDIDVITMATLPNGIEQSVLLSLPGDWPKGSYRLWIEVAAEGDYNGDYNDIVYPTPEQPAGEWDLWAVGYGYGYAYRGQPSVAYVVPLELGEPAQEMQSTDAPAGQSSWSYWSEGFGQMQPMSHITDNPSSAPGSGADRLRRIDGKPRVTVVADVFGLAEPVGDDPWQHIFGTTGPIGDGDGDGDGDGNGDGDGDGDGDGGGQVGDGDGDGDSGSGGAPGGAGGASGASGASGSDAPDPGDAGGEITEGANASVGRVRDLKLTPYDDELRSHSWINLEFRAVESTYPVHRYEVRISEDPITDMRSFLRGRPAKQATTAKDGPFALMLPTDVEAGETVRGSIGELTALTTYYVAVRAVNRRNQAGPIAYQSIRTTKRTFATVTPCFIATAAYGTPLAPEVSALRRVRDRYLMPSALGRALVERYYAWSPALAEDVRERPWLGSIARAGLSPLLAVTRWLLG